MDRVKELVAKGEISQARLVDFQPANPIPGGQLQGLTETEAEDFQDNWNETLSTWVGSQLPDDAFCVHWVSAVCLRFRCSIGT